MYTKEKGLFVINAALYVLHILSLCGSGYVLYRILWG